MLLRKVKRKPFVYVRLFKPEDHVAVLAIQGADIGQKALTEKELHKYWRNKDKERDYYILVAMVHQGLEGYLIYSVEKTANVARLERLAVQLGARRYGVGRELVKELREELQKMHSLCAVTLHEENLEAQLFFKETKVIATRPFVIWGYFDKGKPTERDAFHFNIS